MIKSVLFDQAHLGELKRALAVYSGRHRVVAENIANVETPRFRAQEYRFEELLQGAGQRLRLQPSRPGHLGSRPGGIAETEGKILARQDDYDNGVNNVDIDREMSDLVTTDLSYRLATRLLSMKYNILRGAINGRVR